MCGREREPRCVTKAIGRVCACKLRSTTVWQVCAKIHHFGKLFKVFGNFTRVYWGFGPFLNLLREFFVPFVNIFIVISGQIFENNFSIWSHWSGINFFEFVFKVFLRGDGTNWRSQSSQDQNFSQIKNKWSIAKRIRKLWELNDPATKPLLLKAMGVCIIPIAKTNSSSILTWLSISILVFHKCNILGSIPCLEKVLFL